MGSPFLLPTLAGPSCQGLLQSCSLCRQRRELGAGESRPHTDTPSPSAPELRTAGIQWAQERGDPAVTQSPAPRPNQRS